jgi:DNA-binding NarL/FixJ family response regulator
MRVVLADDAALLREGLARVLTEAGIDVAAQAGTASDLLAAVERVTPDVAVVDIKMPPTHSDEGLVAAAQIRRRYPQVGVLLLSQYVEADYALRLLQNDTTGIGYLLKDRVLDITDFAAALTRVAAGETVVDPALVTQLVHRARPANPLDQLTPRERDVLSLIAEGLTDRGIATRLFVSLNTVETHVRHILDKLDLPANPTDNRRVRAVLTYLRTN